MRGRTAPGNRSQEMRFRVWLPCTESGASRVPRSRARSTGAFRQRGRRLDGFAAGNAANQTRARQTSWVTCLRGLSSHDRIRTRDGFSALAERAERLQEIKLRLMVSCLGAGNTDEKFVSSVRFAGLG